MEKSIIVAQDDDKEYDELANRIISLWDNVKEKNMAAVRNIQFSCRKI